MSINLIKDAWIPVRLADGTPKNIRPADLTANPENPPVELDAARPDYDGALIQILIGLYQCFLPPKDENAWWDWLTSPPAPETLHSALSEWAFAFDLLGEHAFFQDTEELPEKYRSQIDSLHLTAPGGNTVTLNKDIFLKRRDSYAMCPTCAALGLATAQFNATAGGPGFRTSVRGGGPITTILRGENLFHDVWLNVAPSESAGVGSVSTNKLAETLPWMGTTRESSKGGVETPTAAVNTNQAYWSSSKRLQLEEPRRLDTPEYCDACGKPSTVLFETYRELRYGTNYTGPWIHPLTPYTYSEKQGDAPNPLKGSPDGFAYKHWRGIVATHEESKQNRRPATIVEHFRSLREPYLKDDAPGLKVRVWAFGFDADNAKIRSWHEGTFPIIALPDEATRKRFDDNAKLMIEAADSAANELKLALKRALYGRVEITSTGKRNWNYDKSASTDASLFTQAATSFWRATELEFYRALDEMASTLESASPLDQLKVNWLRAIKATSLELFNETAAYGNFRNADPKTSSMALSALRWAFHLSETPGAKSGHIAKALNIAIPTQKQEKAHA